MSSDQAHGAGPTAPASPMLNRRNMLIGGAMLGAVGIGYARQPTVSEPLLGRRKLDDVVPKTLGPWKFETASGLVLPPPDQMRDEIYSDLLTRVYYAPNGDGVMLLVAYSGSQDGVIQVHRPEVCYPASGYTLTRTEERALDVGPRKIPTRFIVAEGGGRLEQLIYWTRLGPSFPTTWLQQRIDVIEENLKGLIPDGVLVRISTNALDSASGIAIIERFAADFIGALPAVGRRVMIG
ncbi:EpsI family protein [Sphingomonas jejuensis]|uniref:EpsI family protein n=1 Tax=Sphingomonas jejuensis TaxID=904715 RepID=A0ABX0XLR5_9SPHN|nr:exosortase-associated protein EpsI, V-type [Sphingomonas jejuensis]NJC33706.1 EpsI family protein [Sphingomonas jejuensis]